MSADLVANGGKADMARTAHFGSEGPRADLRPNEPATLIPNWSMITIGGHWPASIQSSFFLKYVVAEF
jgi:hypothetical protein